MSEEHNGDNDDESTRRQPRRRPDAVTSSSHGRATAALCLSSFTNGFLVISIFPYAGYMAMDLLPDDAVTRDDAGVYAGILSSAFFAGRLVTAYQWGHWADTYGRVGVLQTVLIFSGVFSVLFGMSTSFSMAILWRTCLGMVNGIVSTTKTAAQEIAWGDPVLERRAMGLVLGMRSWSLLLGPAVAGFLAEPLQQYPHWETTAWQRTLLTKYPFVLPNLVIALLCVLAATAVGILVPETLVHRRSLWDDVQTWCQRPTPATNDEHKALLRHDEDESTGIAPRTSATPTVWQRYLTRQHLILHWIFSFISTYVDEAFPLFCLAGLHLTEGAIGQILSVAGLLFAALQYVSFATLTHHLGIYKSLWLGCVAGTWIVAALPLMEYVSMFSSPPPSPSSSSSLKLGMLLIGSICMGLTKLFHSLYFVSMAVAINKTVETHQRAKMNALVLTGNSVVKAAGPLLAGSVVTWCFTTELISQQYGGWIIFGLVPAMGLFVATRVVAVERAVVAADQKDGEPDGGQSSVEDTQ